jgi:preprotein translocase subunit SecA
MRLFGGERIQGLMDTLKLEDDVPIENGMLTNSIESAQKKVEARNFGIRKSVLDFDDVMNRQRELIYGQRAKVLDGDDMSDYIQTMID